MIALLLFLSVLFHTTTQLDEWFEDWSTRVGDDYLTGQLLAELDDMHERHPYWGDPPVAPTSHLSSSGVSYSVAQWESLVERFFPADAVATAMCLMGPESEGNPYAHSYANSIGLMQIHAPSWAAFYGVSWNDLYDPVINMRIAADIYLNHGGWFHWNPWNRGLCR